MIISGVLGNRCDIAHVNELRYLLFQLEDVFKNIKSSDNGPGEEIYMILTNIFKEFCIELVNAWGIKGVVRYFFFCIFFILY